MGDERFQAGAKRSISAAQLASSDAGATSRLVCVAAVRLPLEYEQQRKHLNGFAEAHVVGQARSQAELREQIEPAHADLLVRPQRAVQRGAGVDSRQSLRTAQVLSAFPPATDRRPPGPNRRRCRLGAHLLADIGAGEQAHGFPESQTVLRRGALDLLGSARSCGSAVRRSTSTQRPRTSASPSDLASSSRISAAVSGSPSSVTSIWKSSSASWPSPDGALAADRAPSLAGAADGCPAMPRACAPPRPRVSSCGTSLKSCMASSASSAADGRSRPRSTIAFSHGQLSDARCTGRSSDKQALLVGRARVFAQSLTQRQMLRFGVR